MTKHFLLLAVVAATALTASCGSGSSNSRELPGSSQAPLTQPSTDTAVMSPVEPNEAGVDMFFDYPRYLWHLRRLNVATTNIGTEPLHVLSITLRTDHFEDLPTETKTTTIQPGARIDIQADFGEIADCDPDITRDAAVVVELRHESALETTARSITVDAAPLDEIHDRECALRRIEEAMSINFSDESDIDGAQMSTSIEVERLDSDERIVVSSVRGSVILRLEPAELTEPRAVLEQGEAAITIPLDVEVTRCGDHTVSQSTRTFELLAFIGTDDEKPIRFPIPINDEQQTKLQSLINSCRGLASDT